MKKKTHNLSILLLKPSVNSVADALKDASHFSTCEVTLGEQTAQLFHRQTPGHSPSWIQLFKPQVGTALDGLLNSGTAAVLIINFEGRYFAITFGYGKSLLKPDCYEENFGLKVVLNSVDPEKLRSVDVQSLDAIPVHVRTQASVATNLSEFGLDIEQDLIYAATGQPEDQTFGKQITGKDALRLSIPISLDGLPPLLSKLLVQFSATTYRKNFAWVDHLSEVRDPTRLTVLDEALTSKIEGGDFARTWLSTPDIIDWSSVSGFKYQRPKKGELLGDIGWDSYLAFVGTDTPHSADTFRKQYVLCMSDAAEQPIHEWPVYRCIYCELESDGHTYALNTGRWYRVDANFLNALNTRIKEIPVADLELPSYSDSTEGDYNKRVYDSNTSYFALMDKKLISYGGGSSKIEFCDLLTKDRHLIHVKRYGGSSVLSHLFAQGLVATRLFLAEKDFRNKLNTKLPQSHKLQNPEEMPVAGDFEVVYAIASNSPEDCFELPLFSKINLRNCQSQLQLMGVKVSMAIIPVT